MKASRLASRDHLHDHWVRPAWLTIDEWMDGWKDGSFNSSNRSFQSLLMKRRLEMLLLASLSDRLFAKELSVQRKIVHTHAMMG